MKKNNIIEFFSGKKTYISVIVGVVVTGLAGMGYISDDVFEMLATLAGFLGLGFLRASK